MILKSKASFSIFIFFFLSSMNSIYCNDNVTFAKAELNELRITNIYREIPINQIKQANSKIVRISAVYREIKTDSKANKIANFNQNNGFELCLKAYPIPAQDKIKLSILSNSVISAKIDVYSEKGNVILTKSSILNQGINILDFSLGLATPGIYLFVVNTGVNIEKTKFIIVK
jgi:hypothetical protein